MKRTLKREWSRVRLPTDKLYYWTPISEYLVTQVWRDGGFWRWAIVGFSNVFLDNSGPRPVRTPFVWKQGTAQTMNEACWYAEQKIETEDGEQLVMALP